MIFKYIIVDSGAILFNEQTTHKQVADGFPKVYGAGFYDHNTRKCYGESTSLEIKSTVLDIFVVLDLFEPISKIKYGILVVKDFYEEESSVRKKKKK